MGVSYNFPTKIQGNVFQRYFRQLIKNLHFLDLVMFVVYVCTLLFSSVQLLSHVRLFATP